MTLTREEIKKLFPQASEDCLKENETDNRSQVSHAKPERNKAAALGSAAQRKALCMERTTVCFIGYRVKPLDPDNFAGSCKDLLDGLRHAALIPEDTPWHIKLETEQVKVSSYSKEKTIIYIES